MNNNIDRIKYSLNQIREIKNKILNLSKEEQIEIFKILKKNNESFSENRNGVFINMNNLSDSILNQIILFIDFCNENKKKMKINKQILNDLKKDFSKKEKKKENSSIEKKEKENMYIYNTQKESYKLSSIEQEILNFSYEKKKKINLSMLPNKIKNNLDNSIII